MPIFASILKHSNLGLKWKPTAEKEKHESSAQFDFVATYN